MTANRASEGGTVMTSRASRCAALTAVGTLVISGVAHAGVSYTFDKAAWEAAAGGAANITQINFADVPAWTTVSNQWAAQGVTFTDGDDWTANVYMGSYPQYLKRAIVGKDVWNVHPPGIYDINIKFDMPIRFWGSRPGASQFFLFFYLGDVVVDSVLVTNIPLNNQPPQDTFYVFTGFERDTPFDRVRVSLSVPPPEVDAAPMLTEFMSFAVPAPGAALFIVLGAAIGSCRRRMDQEPLVRSRRRCVLRGSPRPDSPDRCARSC